MTIRLVDVQPKTGPVINLKPYAGYSYGRKTWRPTSVVTRRKNEKAIEVMRAFVTSK